MSDPAPVKLDLWMDVQCSWCFLNSQRLDGAVAALGAPVDIRSRFFELGPDSPDKVDKEALLRAKGLSEEALRAGQAHLNNLGQPYGVQYEWDRMVPTNSRRAHRILLWAQDEGLRTEATKRLYQAYFTEGLDLSDPVQLATLAADAGLDEGRAKQVADESADLDRRLDIDRAQGLRLGVTGVPLLVIADKYALAGAQEEQQILDVLRRVSAGELAL